MRDPKRIPRILAKIGVLWSLVPDQRFCQLLQNMEGLFGLDVTSYYKEDNHLEEKLDEAIKHLDVRCEAPEFYIKPEEIGSDEEDSEYIEYLINPHKFEMVDGKPTRKLQPPLDKFRNQ